jgi:hypothetical protein
MAWITGGQEQRPQLIGRVGRARLPAPTTVVARVFRPVQRFYATRGGVHAGLRAKRARRLLLVV